MHIQDAGGGDAPVRVRVAMAIASMAIVVGLALTAMAMSSAADPVADAGPDIQDYTGRPVVLEGFGTADTGLRIILYEWDFDGDGTFDWNSTRTGVATNLFFEAGEYRATIQVTQYDASNENLTYATDACTVKIISGQPVGRVTSSSTAQVDRPHRLSADYYDPDGGRLEFQWRVEGVIVSDLPSFKHTFKELRDYNVTLKVTDDEDESVSLQVDVHVVEELREEPRDLSDYYTVIVIVLLLSVVAFFAYRAVLRGSGERQEGAPSYKDLAVDSPAIMTEASLADRQAEPETRSRPRVVRPERVVISPEKAKGKGHEVPAAPARLPCPECGTTLAEEGTCPFCSANEAIDEVERQVRGLEEDGYIIAEVEDRLDAAKADLHIKAFDGVEANLKAAGELMEEAVREHERCMTLLTLVDELVDEAKDRDVDVAKAANLIKLSKSFMKSGKYVKAVYYAEKSRDRLLESLEPFDLDRYFCEHCKGEVAEVDDECPHCAKPIESGLIRRAKRELAELRRRFEAMARDHADREPIASQLEKATVHVASRSAAAAREHIENARRLLDGIVAAAAGRDTVTKAEGAGPPPLAGADEGASDEGGEEGRGGTPGDDDDPRLGT